MEDGSVLTACFGSRPGSPRPLPRAAGEGSRPHRYSRPQGRGRPPRSAGAPRAETAARGADRLLYPALRRGRDAAVRRERRGASTTALTACINSTRFQPTGGDPAFTRWALTPGSPPTRFAGVSPPRNRHAGGEGGKGVRARTIAGPPARVSQRSPRTVARARRPRQCRPAPHRPAAHGVDGSPPRRSATRFHPARAPNCHLAGDVPYW